MQLTVTLVLIGLRCAELDADAEEALRMGVAATLDGVAAGDVGPAACVDDGGTVDQRRALLLDDSANVTLAIDVLSASPAADVRATVASQITSAATSGALSAAMVDAADDDVFATVAVARTTVSLAEEALSETAAPTPTLAAPANELPTSAPSSRAERNDDEPLLFGFPRETALYAAAGALVVALLCLACCRYLVDATKRSPRDDASSPRRAVSARLSFSQMYMDEGSARQLTARENKARVV